MQAHFATLGWPEVIVCEDAEGFTRGKSAVESAHKYRGVIELFCALNDIRYESVQPADIKRFATGKGNADKEAMLLAAGKLYGYRGNDDNEADAIIIREWGLRYLFKNDEHKMTA
jgi:Holliday junction resolvasome RuvABC endonuclease subunit